MKLYSCPGYGNRPITNNGEQVLVISDTTGTFCFPMGIGDVPLSYTQLRLAEEDHAFCCDEPRTFSRVSHSEPANINKKKHISAQLLSRNVSLQRQLYVPQRCNVFGGHLDSGNCVYMTRAIELCPEFGCTLLHRGTSDVRMSENFERLISVPNRVVRIFDIRIPS